MTTCLGCGVSFMPKKGLGRPRRNCENCRPSHAGKPHARPKVPKKAAFDTEAPVLDGENHVCAAFDLIPGSGPFTVEHFREWTARLELDNGDMWVLEDFQAAFIADVFSGVSESWLIIPEGNGKTTLMAGLALYHSLFRRNASVKVAASAADQAQILYGQAEVLVKSSPELSKLFRCLEGYKRINCESMNSRIQILSADDKTGDGVIPTLCILDELHRHRDLRLYRTWRGKLAKRKGQMVAISTAGEPGSEFENTREKIRQQSTVVERQETFLRAAGPHLILHEWAVPEDGNVEDIALVKRANPFSGVTVDILAEKLGSPTTIRPHWCRFVCNLPSRSMEAAITESEWAAAETDERIPQGQPIYLGLDVAWKWDCTAAVPLWVRDPEFRLLGPATVLVPPRTGDSLPPDDVERALWAIHTRNPIHTVVMDVTRAEQLAEWIRNEIGATVIERQQTASKQAEDCETFMEELRVGHLHHCGDQALTTHALNAIYHQMPDERFKFERPRASRFGGNEMQSRRVIDGLVASAMVVRFSIDAAEPEAVPLVAWGN